MLALTAEKYSRNTFTFGQRKICVDFVDIGQDQICRLIINSPFVFDEGKLRTAEQAVRSHDAEPITNIKVIGVARGWRVLQCVQSRKRRTGYLPGLRVSGSRRPFAERALRVERFGTPC